MAGRDEDERLAASRDCPGAVEESRLRRTWWQASRITGQLLSAPRTESLHAVAVCARELVEAELAAIELVPPGGAESVVEVAVGGDEALPGRRFQLDGTVTATVMRQRRPLVLAMAQPGTGLVSIAATVGDCVLVVPLLSGPRPLGAMTFVRHAGDPRFSAAEVEAAEGFAAQASIAVELARARERDRVARDLHDHVIQQMFATGLTLQTLAAMAADGRPVSEALQDKVHDIDRIIREIRASMLTTDAAAQA